MEDQVALLSNLFNKVLSEKNSVHNLVHLRDLPSFRGEGHESAEDFLLKFERVGEANNWDDADRLRHLYLCLEKTALKWHDQNKGIKNWKEIRKQFLATFGKTRVDVDLRGDNSKKLIAENPLNYVFNCLEYLKVSDPHATEETKVNSLFDGLPTHSHSYETHLIQ